MTVYAIDNGRHTKVGYTRHDPFRRARQLQVGSSDALDVLWAVDGSPELEAYLHHRLAPYHVRGEWFDLRAALSAFAEPWWPDDERTRLLWLVSSLAMNLDGVR